VRAAAAGRQNVDINAWVETYNARFGLDQPLWKQYANYWWDLIAWISGFRYSIIRQRSCRRSRQPYPGRLALCRWRFAGISGRLDVRCIAGLAELPWLGPGIGAYLDGHLSHPFYLFGLALIWIFAVELRALHLAALMTHPDPAK